MPERCSLQPGVLGSLQDVFRLLFIFNWRSLPLLSTDVEQQMHPENGLHMATEAKNMKMVWDPLPSEFTIRSDNIYDQLHYKNITDRMMSHVRYRSTVFPVTMSLVSNPALALGPWKAMESLHRCGRSRNISGAQ